MLRAARQIAVPSTAATSQRRDLRRIASNFRGECDSAALYQALARGEHNSDLGTAFRRLAEQELEHAAFWEQRLRESGGCIPRPTVSLRTRLLARMAHSLGVQFVIPWITARELRDRYRYAQQNDAAAAGLPEKEQAHVAAMRSIGTEAAALIGGAAALQNGLRAAVLAATDGLTSNFCLLMGVAGGGASRRGILLAGVAGMVAGACSMALGEWLSLTNARELAGGEIDRELEQLERRRAAARPDGEVASRNGRVDPRVQPPHWTAHPRMAATVSFVLFAGGALIPLLPFLWTAARVMCIASALLALFVLGVMTSFFNGRGALYSGLRQLSIGAAAAAFTYTAGWIFGAIV